jgi:hypothetical protein
MGSEQANLKGRKPDLFVIFCQFPCSWIRIVTPNTNRIRIEDGQINADSCGSGSRSTTLYFCLCFFIQNLLHLHTKLLALKVLHKLSLHNAFIKNCFSSLRQYLNNWAMDWTLGQPQVIEPNASYCCHITDYNKRNHITEYCLAPWASVWST